MSKSSFVFLDPKGRRWLWARLLVAAAILTLLAMGVVFIKAVWVQPDLHLPEGIRSMKVQLKAMETPPARDNGEKPWARFQQLTPQPPRKAEPSATPVVHTKIAAALLAGWDPRSLTSLAEHAGDLTHICPEMMFMSGQPAELHVEADPDMLAAIHATKLQIVPVLSNSAGDHWDTDAVEGLVQTDVASQQAFFKKLNDALQDVGASAVLLDWQGVDPALSNQLTACLGKLRDYLRTQGKELWLSLPVGDDLRVFDLEHLPDSVDRFVAQLHDKNAEDDPAGPVASQAWFEGWVKTLLAYGDPDQWILSLGAYGYDWNKATRTTATISFADAMARAQRSGVQAVTSGAPDYNPGFSYDLADAAHEVWFLDASTFANQLRVAEREDCAGVLVNRLGTEDPGIWPVLAQHAANVADATLLTQLQPIEPHNVIAQIGDGDFLRAEMDSMPGHRELQIDDAGYFTESYLQWPKYTTVIHLGDIKPQRVALSFDDGPDPEWTPKILDILKAHHVHATFFVVGVNAEAHPELIRRILAEGHEIGSHTYTHPNLSEASTEKITLELNATQRLIEWISKRSTILFRPPYNADSMPASVADVRTIAMASDMGYITVGESIDPQDWARPGADEIFRRVHDQRSSGSIILLHDAGGDRSQTVEALPKILDYLDTRGDSIARVGQLIGMNRKQTNPAVAITDSSTSRLITNIGLLIAHWAEEFLWAFMIVTSLLTLLRSLILAFLALRKRPVPDAPETHAPLSVVIAAYNEGKVISGTIRSVLGTDYDGPLELLVVDDGSTDDTAVQAEAAAAGDPRVRVLRQQNTGKAGALANGFATAKYDTLIFLDADTHFQADTLRKLVRPLSDPKVGAVSGHARVGNLRTWIARFQGLEYTCGFNLDRRAYDYINAITVVPGAISAFRREAIVQAGGFATDTIAEDTDLTLSLHRFGWEVTYAADAIAWTEAPETIPALASQRFRWAFGTMQCLWKHRDLILNPRFGGLGCFSLPSVILFQILLIAVVPGVDFLLVISLLSGAGVPFVAYFLAFLLCDLFLAVVACRIEGTPLRQAFWIIPMRFLYRPILSWVIWRSILHVLRGAWVGWGKLERKGGMVVPALGN